MGSKDIRWLQRFNNYRKALSQLQDFVEAPSLNKREELGLIQSFEYTFELAWSTIKDFYESQGEIKIQGARDSFRLAFNRGLITNGDLWMKMIIDRNNSSHSYNEETVKEIKDNILKHYYKLFQSLRNSLEELEGNENSR